MGTVTRIEWRHWGDEHRLLGPCYLNGRPAGFHHRLGHVKPRGDGRFDWWRRPNSKHWPVPDWVGREAQGVAATLGEALARVEEGIVTVPCEVP